MTCSNRRMKHRVLISAVGGATYQGRKSRKGWDTEGTGMVLNKLSLKICGVTCWSLAVPTKAWRENGVEDLGVNSTAEVSFKE